MSDFFSFLKTFVACGTLFFIVFLILLALPKSAMRSVALEVSKYVFAGAMAFLWVSPVDCIPSVVPLAGMLDDVGYIAAGWAAINSAMKDRKQRRFVEACDNARLARMAGLNVEEAEPSNGHGTDRGAA